MHELKQFEVQKSHLFHGSPQANLQWLEPRPPVSSGRPDGSPCIAATENLELAIFMAVFKARAKHSFGWSIRHCTEINPYGLYANPIDYAAAQSENWFGHVYLIERNEHIFKPLKMPDRLGEWRASASIQPLGSYPVDIHHLTSHILTKATPQRYITSQFRSSVLQ